MTPKLTKAQEMLLSLYNNKPIVFPWGHQITPHRKLKRLGLVELVPNTVWRFRITEAGRKVCETLKK